MKIYGEDPGTPEEEAGDWRDGKVVVMQALTDSQVATVLRDRDQGLSDTQIWRSLQARRNPPKQPCRKTAEFTVKLEQLTKAQLVLLIERTMDCSLDSLDKMTRDDLIKLIRNFGEARQPRITLTP